MSDDNGHSEIWPARARAWPDNIDSIPPGSPGAALSQGHVTAHSLLASSVMAMQSAFGTGPPISIPSLQSRIAALETAAPGPGAGRPPLANSLPASPADGAEYYFQNSAMATAGVAWQVRFRSASGWEFVGGPPLTAQVDGELPVGLSGNWQSIPNGPVLNFPLAGTYIVTWGAMMYAYGGMEWGIRLNVSNSTPGHVNQEMMWFDVVIGPTPVARTTRRIVAAGAVADVQVLNYERQGQDFRVANPYINLLPVRLS